MSNARDIYRSFLKQSEARFQNAMEVTKQAADEEALHGIKDPNCAGETSIPGFDSALRNGMPSNSNNLGEPDRLRGIFSVSEPNGTGQGTYIAPANGNAKDEAFNSPTTPLEKIAESLRASSELLKGANPGYQQPVDGGISNHDMPQQFAGDADLMSKLASLSLVMLGTEDGARAVEEALEKEAGAVEARSIINQIMEEASEGVYKQASEGATESVTIPYAEFQKAAAGRMAHEQWMASTDNELLKRAYAQGAADGDAAAAAMEQGGAPEVPGTGEVTAEDLMAYLQELVQNQVISPEEAEVVLQYVGAAADDGLENEELAQALSEAVNAGQLDPNQAAAVAQQYLQDMGGAAEGGMDPGAGVPEEAADAAAAAAMQDPAAAGAAEEGVQKAASVINYLWGN